MRRVKAGIVGCGAIAPAYVRNLLKHFSTQVELVACADVVEAQAVKLANEFGLPRWCSPAALLADPAIELVLNLTPAPAHHAVSRSILEAGKHLFSEKPLALSREDARDLLALASARGLRIGGAADTFLGAGVQLARKLVDLGCIGTPVAAQGVVAAGYFHSERYHQVFRGALLDLGPYYLTALIAILGPVARVSGAAEIRFPDKPQAAGTPEEGRTFAVDLPTSVSAAFDFAEGPVGSLIASHDLHGNYRRLEILGTRGALTLHDPNHYMGTLVLRTAEGEKTMTEAPGFGERGRGLGVAEMALALREGRPPRSSGALMYHVLDVSLAIHDSSAAGEHVRVQSRIERPEPFDFGCLRAEAAVATAGR